MAAVVLLVVPLQVGFLPSMTQCCLTGSAVSVCPHTVCGLCCCAHMRASAVLPWVLCVVELSTVSLVCPLGLSVWEQHECPLRVKPFGCAACCSCSSSRMLNAARASVPAGLASFEALACGGISNPIGRCLAHMACSGPVFCRAVLLAASLVLLLTWYVGHVWRDLRSCGCCRR